MADVGLHGFFREEEMFADLSIHETVCDELQYLDLACGRVLADLARRRGREGDDRSAAA